MEDANWLVAATCYIEWPTVYHNWSLQAGWWTQIKLLCTLYCGGSILFQLLDSCSLSAVLLNTRERFPCVPDLCFVTYTPERGKWVTPPLFWSENFFRRAEKTFCGYWIRVTRNAPSGKVGSSHCYLQRRPLHEIATFDEFFMNMTKKHSLQLVYVALSKVIFNTLFNNTVCRSRYVAYYKCYF